MSRLQPCEVLPSFFFMLHLIARCLHLWAPSCSPLPLGDGPSDVLPAMYAILCPYHNCSALMPLCAMSRFSALWVCVRNTASAGPLYSYEGLWPGVLGCVYLYYTPLLVMALQDTWFYHLHRACHRYLFRPTLAVD